MTILEKEKNQEAPIETKNDQPLRRREEMNALLNQQLADVIDLQGQCKQAHWNVKGPQFYSLHKLFDKVHEAVSEYVDMIAERIVQLGGEARGTVRTAAQSSRLPIYPPAIVTGEEHCEALASALASFARGAREAIKQSDKAGDDATADIFTEITRGADQWLWMVESQLHETA
jgi:starvation-inducible DNA-binding protein